jgi:hypothetical protein
VFKFIILIINFTTNVNLSRSSSVNIVTKLRAGRPGFDYKQGNEESFWGSPNHLSHGYREFFPRVKQLWREADHSPPPSAEVKNVWSYTSTPSYVFMTWCLVKYRIRLHDVILVTHRENFHPVNKI